MKNIFKILSILSIIVFSLNNTQAQTSKYNGGSLNGSEFNFPPLRVVMDSVLKRSAMVIFRNYNVQAKEAKLATESIHWSKNIGVQADTRYGNLSNFAASENGLANTASFTTARQFNYSVGLFIKFPLFDAINRKNQIKLAKSEVEAAKSMAAFEKEQIRQTVIVRYQDLIFKHKLLQIKSRSLGDVRVNRQMVEKEFRNGIVPLSEYVKITNITADMEAAYEKAISDLITAKKLLEDMAGFVFGLTLKN
jgi:outer membrane protein TolC